MDFDEELLSLLDELSEAPFEADALLVSEPDEPLLELVAEVPLVEDRLSVT